ncbi:MAG TPA: PhzF family phenazine biosynthesis protein [Acidimicrobiia bacterium]|nr:PhzF family phenazine biosynthesis protein [Acidimicrobiia bacterium]
MATLLCIDTFTAEAFRGNPAGVCLVDDPMAFPEERMQAIAAELRLSETAFVASDGDAYSLRWFTPTQEALLCGHGTLASAHALWTTGRLDLDRPARFATRWKGELTARRIAGPATATVAVDFPAASSKIVDTPAGLEAAIGASVAAVGSNDLHHVVEVADEGTVRALAPDSALLMTVPAVEAITVTARSDDPSFDFVSRYFAPRHGIVEDPVTGSAHTSLGPWWAERLGRSDLVGHQVSRRSGIVRVRVDDPGPDRVTIEGDLVTVWQGELLA